MKVLTTIVFVLGLLVFGNCQTKQNTVQHDAKKTLWFSAGYAGFLNAIIIDDEWLDTQETNELENFVMVSILPHLYSDTWKMEICSNVPGIYEIHSNSYSPLYLDLPPPLISILP